MNYEQALGLLKQYGQEHLLRFYDELSESEREELLREIGSLDFSVLELLRDRQAGDIQRGELAPLGALTIADIEARRNEYVHAGLQAIRDGKTAAVLLAGGQGTRLGFDKPKGCYNIGVNRELLIFQCLIRNLMDVTDAAGACIPLYIMTSEINNRDTIECFESHDYFGYPKEMVRFFIQEMAPCVGFDGRILLEKKGKIACSPNGNGGWYTSLRKAGYAKELLEKGVETISVFGVDNVCQRINDPAYLGAFLRSGRSSAGKVVKKADPNERVGVLCLEDGRPSIVEYYEMTDDMIHLRDEKGELLYNYGVTLNYLFRLPELEENVTHKLMTHIVEKKIPHIDGEGNPVKPAEPNGYKFELLVLDMIHMMDSCLPYEVDREYEFAPVKNAAGVDSVESARALLLKNHVIL